MNLFSVSTADSIVDLMKRYIQYEIESRLENELGPLRQEIDKKVRQIYEEEIAKFSVNMWSMVRVDRLEKELVIRIENEKEKK